MKFRGPAIGYVFGQMTGTNETPHLHPMVKLDLVKPKPETLVIIFFQILENILFSIIKNKTFNFLCINFLF